MRSFDLTDEEILLLDGRCRSELQPEVDAARLRLSSVAAHPALPDYLAAFVADVVTEAKKEGKLAYTPTRASWCRLCKRSAGYAKYKRSGYGHKKGDENRSKPLVLWGYDFADRFIRIQGHISLGGCETCIEAVKPALLESLRDIPCELPERLTGAPPVWKKWGELRCLKCKWQGHEGQLGLLPTLMGDGRYRGQCPGCKAKEGFLHGSGVIFERLKTHNVVKFDNKRSSNY